MARGGGGHGGGMSMSGVHTSTSGVHVTPASGQQSTAASQSHKATSATPTIEVAPQSGIPQPQPFVPTEPSTGTANPMLGGADANAGAVSPRLPDIFATSGGTAGIDHSGGGGNTLASCMGFWDNTTHMSRAEWRQTCVRTLNGIDLPVEMGGPQAVASGSSGSRVTTTSAPSRAAHHARTRHTVRKPADDALN
jgi:hypothetical protein